MLHAPRARSTRALSHHVRRLITVDVERVGDVEDELALRSADDAVCSHELNREPERDSAPLRIAEPLFDRSQPGISIFSAAQLLDADQKRFDIIAAQPLGGERLDAVEEGPDFMSPTSTTAAPIRPRTTARRVMIGRCPAPPCARRRS